MIKAILFDLDGTLLNTSIDIYKTLNESLSVFNLPKVTLADTIKFIGNGAKKLIVRAVGDKEEYIERVYSDYIVRFAKCGNSSTTLYEGEREFLFAAKKAGIKLAIITNKPQNATEVVCAQLLSEFGFDLIIGMSDRFALKPDPESTLYAINKLETDKKECLFIGDGETDVLTAKNAGVLGISALWGYRDKETLANFGALHFAKDYYELYNFVFNNKTTVN